MKTVFSLVGATGTEVDSITIEPASGGPILPDIGDWVYWPDFGEQQVRAIVWYLKQNNLGAKIDRPYVCVVVDLK